MLRSHRCIFGSYDAAHSFHRGGRRCWDGYQIRDLSSHSEGGNGTGGGGLDWASINRNIGSSVVAGDIVFVSSIRVACSFHLTATGG